MAFMCFLGVCMVYFADCCDFLVFGVYLGSRSSLDSLGSADLDVLDGIWTVFGRLQGVFLGFVESARFSGYSRARYSVDSLGSADFEVFDGIWSVFGCLHGIFGIIEWSARSRIFCRCSD